MVLQVRASGLPQSGLGEAPRPAEPASTKACVAHRHRETGNAIRRNVKDAVKPITVRSASESMTVGEFLDRYFTNYVEADGLRDPVTVKGRLKAVKAVLGNEPVTVLERAEPIQRFKASYVSRGGLDPHGDPQGGAIGLKPAGRSQLVAS
jgi:hypothetical protein